MSTTPSVLFVCVKNGGKSQMAAALARKQAGQQLVVYSAGTHPGTKLNAESEASVAEVGASFEGEFPKAIDPTLLDSVDRVVIVGSEAVIEHPGTAPIEVWEVDEPSLRGIEGSQRMALIRDELQQRVTALVAELVAPASR